MHPDPSSIRIGRGFNLVSPIYDAAMRLVFGRSVDRFQEKVIQNLAPVDTALIVGGGSGNILRWAFDSSLASHYVYAELSDAMIARTRARISVEEAQTVRFTSKAFDTDESYDLILFPFVLDCYPPSSILEALTSSRNKLRTGGKLVLIDFNLESSTPYEPRWWKTSFIALLYLFFRSLASIPAKRLPPFQALFREAGFSLQSEDYIYRGWIQSTVWKLEAKR